MFEVKATLPGGQHQAEFGILWNELVFLKRTQPVLFSEFVKAGFDVFCSLEEGADFLCVAAYLHLYIIQMSIGCGPVRLPMRKNPKEQVVAKEVGTGYGNGKYGQWEQQNVDNHPAEVMVGPVSDDAF